jgi:hypothetical protein
MNKDDIKEMWFRCLKSKHKNDYPDNFRFADVDDPQDMIKYKKQYIHGCCGSSDEVYICTNDDEELHIYLYGCNFWRGGIE